MLLHESRRTARLNADGDIILLEDQDRSLWNQDLIAEGRALVEQSLRSRRFGVYTIQAAISAVHAEAKQASETDWAQIVALYDVLLRADTSPVVELNRAVAIAMRDDAARACLSSTRFWVAAIYRITTSLILLAANFFGDSEIRSEAKLAFEQALSLAKQEPEQRFLRNKMAATDSL